MRPPAWKRYLSYLTEFHIESAPSDHNPHLYVSLSRGRYQLCTANAIYSYEDLYDNFGLAFNQMNLDKIEGQRMLILGFGLGSIPFLLEKKHQKKFDYTAVEIDESVLYLANKYMMPDMESSIQFICTDAAVFVDVCQEQFDLIAVDVFLDDIIPDAFQQEDFLTSLTKLLAPKGVLMYNRLSQTKEDKYKSQLFYSDIFKPIFPEGAYLQVNGNWMLFNRKDILRST